MKLDEFKRFIKSIHNARGKTAPGAEVLDFLFEKIGKIPGHALEWIEERFEATYEKFPTVLHAALMACWWDYLREHPEQRAHVERTECRYCQDGRLILEKYEPMHGRMTEYSANCGHCRQRQDEKSIPMMTYDQARAVGYTVLMDVECEHEKSGHSTWNSVASMATVGREPADERRADLR